MDIVEFFRMLITILLAVFCVGLVLAIVGATVGNTCFLLINCFKKENSLEEADKSKKRKKVLSFPEVGKPDNKLPRAS